MDSCNISTTSTRSSKACGVPCWNNLRRLGTTCRNVYPFGTQKNGKSSKRSSTLKTLPSHKIDTEVLQQSQRLWLATWTSTSKVIECLDAMSPRSNHHLSSQDGHLELWVWSLKPCSPKLFIANQSSRRWAGKNIYNMVMYLFAATVWCANKVFNNSRLIEKSSILSVEFFQLAPLDHLSEPMILEVTKQLISLWELWHGRYQRVHHWRRIKLRSWKKKKPLTLTRRRVKNKTNHKLKMNQLNTNQLKASSAILKRKLKNLRYKMPRGRSWKERRKSRRRKERRWGGRKACRIWDKGFLTCLSNGLQKGQRSYEGHHGHASSTASWWISHWPHTQWPRAWIPRGVESLVSWTGNHLTRTPGDDPRSNGRAECAVKTIKTQIRRVLLQAEAPGSWWPWATRFVNELNRAARIGKRPDWPPFLSTVMVRKRKWLRGVFEISTENVKYCTFAPHLKTMVIGSCLKVNVLASLSSSWNLHTFQSLKKVGLLWKEKQQMQSWWGEDCAESLQSEGWRKKIRLRMKRKLKRREG